MGLAQSAFLTLLQDVEVARQPVRFFWLVNRLRPSSTGVEGLLWTTFLRLGGNAEAMARKAERRLAPDAYLPEYNCLLEFDEVQHFTPERLTTLDLMTEDLRLGFDLAHYQDLCRTHAEKAVRKGADGYRRRTVEFPFEGGRKAQRAMFDMTRDLLPPLYGLAPTVRVSEFDLPTLITNRNQARDELVTLLKEHLS